MWEVAQAYAADLKAFSEGHANKAKALSQAMKQFQSTGKPVQVVRGLTQGSWSISPDKLSGKDMADNQGLVVNVKSKNLVQAVRTEAKALIAASQEVDNMMGLAQPSTSNKQPEVASPTEETAIDDEILETQTNESEQEAATQEVDPVTEPAQAEPVESGTDAEPASDPVVRDDVDAPVAKPSKSNDAGVQDLRKLLREWKGLQTTNREVQDIYDAAQKDESLETEAVEDLAEKLDTDRLEASNVLGGNLESMEKHPSPAVQEAIKAFKEDSDYEAGNAEIDEVVDFLTDIGKKATEYDTATPDMFATQETTPDLLPPPAEGAPVIQRDSTTEPTNNSVTESNQTDLPTVTLKEEDYDGYYDISNLAGDVVGIAEITNSNGRTTVRPDIEAGSGYGQATYLAARNLYPDSTVNSTMDLSNEAEKMWNRLYLTGYATRIKDGNVNNGDPEYSYTIPALVNGSKVHQIRLRQNWYRSPTTTTVKWICWNACMYRTKVKTQ